MFVDVRTLLKQNGLSRFLGDLFSLHQPTDGHCRTSGASSLAVDVNFFALIDVMLDKKRDE